MTTVTKLKVIEFLDGLYFSTIITSLYAIASGLSLAHVVFAQGLYSLTVLFMEVPTGIVADKFGRKISLAAGYAMSVFGLVTMVVSPTLAGLYIMRFLQATGSALVSGASEALLYEASIEEKREYKKESSATFANGVLGLSIAGVISGIAYQFYGSASFVPLLILTATLQLVIVVICLSINERKLNSKEAKKEIESWEILIQTIFVMRKNQTIFALTMFGLLAACNEYFLYGTYAPYLDSLHVNKFAVGAVFSVGLLLNFYLMRNIYKLEQYFTLEKILGFIKLLAAVSYIALSIITPQLAILLTVAVAIGVFNIERPIISDFANQEIDSSIRATVLSGMSLASRLSKAILTFIMGVIVTNTSIKSAYYIQGIVIAVGMVIGYWLLVKCGCVRKINYTKTVT